MKKYDYNVMLDTELGNRQGKMQISVRENKIEGILNLLKHTEMIYGNMNTDGSCCLHGKIVTLIKEFSYIATGYIGDNELSLNFKIGSDNYMLKGTAYKGDEN